MYQDRLGINVGKALQKEVFFAGGFLLEVVADEQKRRFRNNPAMAGRFITSAFLQIFYTKNAHFTKTGSGQTQKCRDNPAVAGRFITTGVWGLGSRHPNYLVRTNERNNGGLLPRFDTM